MSAGRVEINTAIGNPLNCAHDVPANKRPAEIVFAGSDTGENVISPPRTPGQKIIERNPRIFQYAIGRVPSDRLASSRRHSVENDPRHVAQNHRSGVGQREKRFSFFSAHGISRKLDIERLPRLYIITAQWLHLFFRKRDFPDFYRSISTENYRGDPGNFTGR